MKKKQLLGLPPIGLARTVGGDSRSRRNDSITATNRHSARAVSSVNLSLLPASATTDDKLAYLERAINEILASLREARMMDK